jgi:uncharacterized protein (TIGR03435 family)
MLTGTILTQMKLADLSPLANHLWQSTLLAIAVWLLTLALRKNRAAVRYGLWQAASVKFLIPFSLLVSLGGRWGWRTASSAAAAQPRWSSAVVDIGLPFTVSAPTLQAVARPTANLLPAIFFVVWLGGFAVSMVLWVRCWRQMRSARKGALPLALGLPIRAMSSPTRIEPGVFGVRKPVLLLPEGITDRLTPAQLQAVLAHEMCHVRRRDNLTAAIHMVVEAVFWFYPLVWWIRARLVEERERACDEAVLESGSDAEVYAEGILSVCKFYVASPLACASGISGSDLKRRIVRIMTERLADNLTLSRKLLLAAVGITAVAFPVLFGVLTAVPSRAQAQTQGPTAPAHVYEVASIKPNKSGDNKVRMMLRPDGFTAMGSTLEMLIQSAYEVQDFQIAGAPGWLNSEKYDVEAKMDASTAEEVKKLGQEEGVVERQRMIQALLADRFQLTLHRETKELPVYALVVAKNGPKLHQAKPGDTYPNGFKDPDGKPGAGMMFMSGRGGPVIAQGLPIANLVRLLSRQLGRTVLDETGLMGNYDFTLQWTPDESQGSMFKGAEGGPAPASAPPPDSSGPSIFTALQEQLGLKLESRKGPVEILVIDHVEKPSAN